MRKHPNTINYEEFGKRLRESREGMDLTQEEFGARINYSGEYVGRLERGEGQFSVQFIADVHDEFGISTDYLLFGTKQGKAYNTKEDHKFILHDNGGNSLEMSEISMESFRQMTNIILKKMYVVQWK